MTNTILTYGEKGFFLVTIELVPPADDEKKTAEFGPKIGKNEYLIRFVYKDTLAAPTHATMILNYSHDHAKIPKTFQAELSPQPDGTVIATAYFEKAGKWNLSIDLTDTPDSGSIQDHYAWSISL